MENAIQVSEKNFISTVAKTGVSELIKPLSQEIFLFDTYVAGTMHLKDDSVLDEIKEGDKLILRREDNRFDEKAILVLDMQERKIGYVPEKDNAVFSRLMDAGKCLTAKIDDIEPRGSFRQINISIYLVDF